MDRPYATRQDFIDNREILCDVWSIYKKLYEGYAIKSDGIISIDEINTLIIKAKEMSGTKSEHEIAVEGFFDSYVAMFTMIGHSGIVHKSIELQLARLLDEAQ